MDSKGKVAIVVALITVVGGILAGGGATSWTFDFSTTITDIETNIDNSITNIINQQFGVDLDEFRTMCSRGEVGEEFIQYCKIVG